MKEGTKATRETKVKGEMMELMDARVRLVILDFPAVKDLPEQMVCRESLDQRETPVRMDRKEQKEILEKMVIQDRLETMAHWDLGVIGALAELMGTKGSVVMMASLDQMDLAGREEQLGRRGSKVPVETEVQEENQGSQDPAESRGGRAQLAPTETLASLARSGLLATEEMKDHLDQREPKDQEESKELRETEARWGRGEKMESREMAPSVVMVSRVILAPAETLVSRAQGEPLDPKEMTEMPEIQALITTNQGFQDLKVPKVTEDLKAARDLQGLPDHQEVMNVKFWTSS